MDEVQAQLARAIALEDAGRPAEALSVYAEILAKHPQHADARHNCGLLLARLGRLQEAEESHREYARAHPGSARAGNDLADVLLARGDYEGALAALQAIREVDATALVRRGVALSCLARFREAGDAFKEALSLNAREVERFARRVAPGGDLDTLLSPENIFIARGHTAQGACDWSVRDAYVAEMRRAASDPGVAIEPAAAYMALVAPLSAQERRDIARNTAARIEAKVPAMPPPGPRGKRGKIRIGVLSPDYREHVVGHGVLPLFELLDRSRFELHAYSLAPEDGSSIRARLRAAADGFHELHPLSDQQAAAAIRRDDVDILVDIAGHTTGGRFAIVAQRPARVQVNYYGFLGTLGSRRVDFAIVDRIIAPVPEEWTESLIYLPSTFFLYDFRPPVPPAQLTRAGYGLPNDAFVYCAFHQASKISPESFELWLDVLRHAPGSVLWFNALPDAAVRRLRARAASSGVAPDRLFIAPLESRARYLERQRLGNLLLDALDHNAMNTGCDALAAGLPVLTLRGQAPASRGGESLLRAADLAQLVASDRREFVEMAVRLGKERGELRDYSRHLQERKAPLFDSAARIRELEAAFEEVLQVSDHSRNRL